MNTVTVDRVSYSDILTVTFAYRRGQAKSFVAPMSSVLAIKLFVEFCIDERVKSNTHGFYTLLKETLLEKEI